MEKYMVFDIGGSAVKYGILSETGEVLSNNKFISPGSWEEMADEMDQVITDYLDEISGVAVSAPGRIDVEEGVIYLGGALPFLHGINIKEHFKEKYNLPAAVVNDGKAAAQAELWMGHLKGVEHAAAIALGTGIGGAVVIDGKVHQGRNFLAGEFSHYLPTDEQLRNNFATTNSSVRLIAELAEMIGLENKSDGEAVFEVINSKENEEVNAHFSDYCRRIVGFILNLQSTLDISHVVIGGGISSQPVLIEEINHQYDLVLEDISFFEYMFGRITIQPNKFSNNANLMGALYQLLLDLGKQ